MNLSNKVREISEQETDQITYFEQNTLVMVQECGYLSIYWLLHSFVSIWI